MDGESTDVHWLDRAQRGDSSALAQLLQQSYLPVKKYLITLCLNRSLAEDLTQETMVRAIQRIGQFSGRSQFSTWLMAIATHLYVDTLRRWQRERRLMESESQSGYPGAEADSSDPDWPAIVERLRRLPRAVALPIVLHHYHGYALAEIARFMGIPEGTVKSRIHHGIRVLRGGEGDAR